MKKILIPFFIFLIPAIVFGGFFDSIVGYLKGSADIELGDSLKTLPAFTISGTNIISRLPSYDCTGNTNGGALTINGSGQVICSDDDMGSGGGGGTQIEIGAGNPNSGILVSSVSFDAGAFNITNPTGYAFVQLDYANGPASRAIAQTISGEWNFVPGATFGNTGGQYIDIDGSNGIRGMTAGMDLNISQNDGGNIGIGHGSAATIGGNITINGNWNSSGVGGTVTIDGGQSSSGLAGNVIMQSLGNGLVWNKGWASVSLDFEAIGYASASTVFTSSLLSNSPSMNIGYATGIVGDINITAGESVGSGLGGGSIVLFAGDGDGDGEGGGYDMYAGSAGAGTGQGGGFSLSAGAGGLTSGDGGVINIYGGEATGDGAGGNINLLPGVGTSRNGIVDIFGSASVSENFEVVGNFYGAGLTSCTGGNKLLWDAGQFSCDTDATGGGGGGALIEIQNSYTDLGSFSSISFDAGHFTVTDTTGEATVKLDWTNGPASRATQNTWTALNTFNAGASFSSNLELTGTNRLGINAGAATTAALEVGGTASISGATTLGSTLGVTGNTTLSTLSASGLASLTNASVSGIFEASNYASASKLYGAGLSSCVGTNKLLWSNGVFSCGTDIDTNTDTTNSNIPFLTLGNTASLAYERSLAVDTANFTLTDGGANSTYTVGLASGLTIPPTASVSAWEGFKDNPSSVITAGTGIDWSTNTLNVDDIYLLLGGDIATGLIDFQGGASVSVGNFEVKNIASISRFNLVDSATGIAMDDCDGDGQALGWDSTNKRFFCGDDDTGVGGSVSSNSLNFDEFQNPLVLDTNISVSSGGYTWDWGSTELLLNSGQLDLVNSDVVFENENGIYFNHGAGGWIDYTNDRLLIGGNQNAIEIADNGDGTDTIYIDQHAEFSVGASFSNNVKITGDTTLSDVYAISISGQNVIDNTPSGVSSEWLGISAGTVLDTDGDYPVNGDWSGGGLEMFGTSGSGSLSYGGDVGIFGGATYIGCFDGCEVYTGGDIEILGGSAYEGIAGGFILDSGRYENSFTGTIFYGPKIETFTRPSPTSSGSLRFGFGDSTRTELIIYPDGATLSMPFEVRGRASASQYYGAAFSSIPSNECSDAGDTLNWANGVFSCGTDAEGAGGGGGSALQIKEGFTNKVNPVASISFDAGAFNVTASGTVDAFIQLDYTNGPASRAMANTWDLLQTFTLGATSSTNFEAIGYASASKYFGASLTDCDSNGSQLLWSNTGLFSCQTLDDNDIPDSITITNLSGTNSGDVTLSGTPNYLTILGQVITLNKLDISDDTNATGGTGITISTNDFSVNTTELEAQTWGAGGNASNLWTFNLSAGDPTLNWTASGATLSLGFEAKTYASASMGFFNTRLNIPDGGSPTFSAIGDIAYDSTLEFFKIATQSGGAAAAIPMKPILWSATVPSGSLDFISGGRLPLPPKPSGWKYIITGVSCAVDSGTSVIINVSNMNGNNDTETVTCDIDGQEDTSIDTNARYTSYTKASSSLEFGTVTGEPDYLIFTIYGYYSE